MSIESDLRAWCHRTKRCNCVLAPVTLLIAYSAWAQSSEITESSGSFILRVTEEAGLPIVNHCAAEVPELKNPLEKAYAEFKAKLKQAGSAVLSENLSEEELSAPVDPIFAAEFQQVRELMLAEVQKQDAGTFCPKLLLSLSNVTAADIRAQITGAVANYENRAQEKSVDP